MTRSPHTFLLLFTLLLACQPKAKVAVPPELTDIATWLKAHPQAASQTRVLTLTDTGAAAALQGGAVPFQESQGQAWLLARDATALVAGMESEGLQYLLTPEPDLHDAPQLPTDKKVLVPSLLRHLQTLYGTGTRDQACVDRLQLVAVSPTTREFGGRHLPAGLLYQRVPGARLHMQKLVPGVPVRVETTRTFAGHVFVFDCQARADAKGELEMRFPYPTLPDARVKMWTAMDKVGDPIEVSAGAVTQGLTVEIGD
jgi:hypothetical protein